MRFPRYKAGNVLRGALGTVLRESADYERVFAPKLANGPSGLKDPPRPFIFRCGHLNGARFGRGKGFCFDVHLFSAQHPIELFYEAFKRLGDTGLGIERGRARLKLMVDIPVTFDTYAEDITKLRIQFITPTELRESESNAPSFAEVFKRARDRVSSLATIYGDGMPDLDYAGLGARAELIETVASDLRFIDAERKSTRTGQVHPIGGFIGSVDYAGPLTEFMPILTAAVWTGVGRHTVWGQGEIRLDCGLAQ